MENNTPQSTETVIPTPTPQEKPIMKPASRVVRPKLLAGLITVALFILAAAMGVNYLVNRTNLSQTTPTPSASPFAFTGKVVYLTGSAWESVDNRRTEIKENDLLSEGDVVATDADTRLVLVFDDGSTLRVGPNSQITLKRLEPANMVIEETAGVLFARVTKDINHLFSIKADSFIVQALGTEFSVENETEVKVKVYESSVKLIDEKTNGETQVNQQQQWQETKAIAEVLNQQEVEQNQFLAWSLTESKSSPTPNPEVETETENEAKPTPQNTSTNGTLTLTGNASTDGVVLNWQVANLDVSRGFKLVKSLDANPTFPEDPYMFFESSQSRSYFWELKDGKAWHFRVCQFLENGACGKYSNEVTVTAPGSSNSESDSGSGNVSSLSLSVTKNGNSAKLTWSVNGYSEKGYKTVWSTSSGPTYPTRENDQFHYLWEPETRQDSVSELESGRTYYFRVCEYLGGQCGLYSNEVSVSF